MQMRLTECTNASRISGQPAIPFNCNFPPIPDKLCGVWNVDYGTSSRVPFWASTAFMDEGGRILGNVSLPLRQDFSS